MSVLFLNFTQVLITLLFGLGFSFLPQATYNTVALTKPTDGEALKGTITIEGNTSVIGFESYDLLFSYENGSNDGDRFLILHSTEKIENGTLGTWDTSKITDGDYRLFLVVNFEDDKPETTFVRNLRVRNYTAEEVENEVMPTEVLPSEDLFLATPVPESEESPQTLFGSMLKGLIYTIVVIVLLGLVLLGVTQYRKRRR